MAQANPVPRYFLYGEPLRDVELDFLHVERIAVRSRIHDWTIRPHSHPSQHQVLYLSEGRADVRIEAQSWHVDAPALVVVPALTVHAFAFSPSSDGFVLTAARDVLDRPCAVDVDLADVLARGGCVGGAALDTAALGDCFAALEQEFVWSAPGRRTAILAQVQRLLVVLARTPGLRATGPAGRPDRDAELVARYREALERGFRLRRGVEALAADIGVTRSRLDRACRAAAARSALALLHERIMIEAKRGLLYTSMTVADVAVSVGFDDPAYFSRFFAAHAGCPPGRFRDLAHGSAQAVAAQARPVAVART